MIFEIKAYLSLETKSLLRGCGLPNLSNQIIKLLSKPALKMLSGYWDGSDTKKKTHCNHYMQRFQNMYMW